MIHFFFKALRISLTAMSISFEGTMGSIVDLVLVAVRFVTITLLLLKHERFSLPPKGDRTETFTNWSNPNKVLAHFWPTTCQSSQKDLAVVVWTKAGEADYSLAISCRIRAATDNSAVAPWR